MICTQTLQNNGHILLVKFKFINSICDLILTVSTAYHADFFSSSRH